MSMTNQHWCEVCNKWTPKNSAAIEKHESQPTHKANVARKAGMEKRNKLREAGVNPYADLGRQARLDPKGAEQAKAGPRAMDTRSQLQDAYTKGNKAGAVMNWNLKVQNSTVDTVRARREIASTIMQHNRHTRSGQNDAPVWHEAWTEDGHKYWYNGTTMETTWNDPYALPTIASYQILWNADKEETKKDVVPELPSSVVAPTTPFTKRKWNQLTEDERRMWAEFSPYKTQQQQTENKTQVTEEVVTQYESEPQEPSLYGAWQTISEDDRDKYTPKEISEEELIEQQKIDSERKIKEAESFKHADNQLEESSDESDGENKVDFAIKQAPLLDQAPATISIKFNKRTGPENMAKKNFRRKIG